jgi:hypothetical protein
MIKIEADMKKKKKITVKPIDTNTDEVLRVINTLRQLIMMNDEVMTNEAFMTIIKRFIDEDEKDLEKIKFEGEK